MPRSIHSIVSAALILAGGSAVADTETKARHARFLAVGDSPPFRQVIRDGVRYELEPPPGSIPPREVLPGFGGGPTKPVPLRLGRISPHVVVPAGEGPLQLWRADDAVADPPWVTMKRPEAGDFLVLLWRKPAADTWNDVAIMTLAETPAGMARIVNLFPLAVNIEWGDENLVLPAGRSILRPVPRNEPVALRILARDVEGAMRRYYSGTVSAIAGERSLVTIYRADGVAPRRPLKVSVLRERVDTPRPDGPGATAPDPR